MNRKIALTPAAYAAILASIPGVLSITPAARWGHQAVYVKSKQAMYIVGGEVPTSGSQITNEVLVLPLNTTNPSFSTESSEGLPPHAFASMIATPDGSSLVVAGGITSSCDSDGTTHTFDLDGDDGWVSTNPNNFLRRRGASAAYVEDSSGKQDMMVVGGIADSYVCASSTHSYPAADVLSLPLSSSSLISSRSLPSSLTGSSQAVSDFSLTTDLNGKIYLTGGQTSSGDFVDMTTVGVWDSTNGWTSQTTIGDVPSGRVGASLVAHPALDILILHGGSTDSNGTPSNLLAFLNTTSWSWSTPSNLQPPSSSAASYHTSVMTDQGVMITAFGLASTGSPRSDVYYLDMRDPSGSSWSWKNQWNNNMLTAYSASTSTTDNTGTVATGISTAQNNTSETGTSGKKIASIAVPILVIALILSPLIVYLARRRMRLIKKRRMARHFSFSSQEDEGAFGGGLFSQYLSQRRTKTQFPFGRDANEREGNFITDLSTGLTRMVTRLSSRSNSDEGHDQDDIPYVPPREMIAVTSGVTRGTGSPKAKENRQMNWEEIDFGLGKLDESKHNQPSSSGSNFHPSSIDNSSPFGDHAAVSASAPMVDFPVPQAQGYTPEMLYGDDSVAPPPFGRLGASPEETLIPYLMVQPATAPPTPSVNNLSTAYPAMIPNSSSAIGGSAPQGGNDQSWESLAKELETKPAFRSISPTAQLRSHAHPSASSNVNYSSTGMMPRSESPRPISPVPSIPPLEFQRRPSTASNASETIKLVKTPSIRRPEFLPFQTQNQYQNQGNRSVSQPISRQIAGGGLGRRGSAASDSPLSSGQTTPTQKNISLSYTPGMRRASGSLIPGNVAGNGSPVNTERRASMLRVVNVTENEEDSTESGQAI
ncbi:uncharacterized protein IL334_006603 [Kwoniella shivajii]|uniref:Galactose oxidase n=1 Tax=Kwoniella shivajii TaxID=564305 RepID=A0ABZ1D834_9TREE|nr:hypothetical protein IL334_006603 [Kwoniella shivajii]